MKKIFALVLVVVMVFAFAACGGEDTKQTSSSETVDPNTVEIVKNAYNKTNELLKSIKAFGYEGVLVVSAKVDDVVSTTNTTVGIDYIDSEDGRKYAIDTTVKLGEASEEIQLYSDGKSAYGYAAGTTYTIANNKDTDEYINTILSDMKVADVDCPIIKTTIIDASIGGHCYVVEYDATNFDPEKIFEDAYTQIKNAGYTINPQKLTVSGTIDAQGRLTSENVTFEFDYDMSIQTQVQDESQAESTASKASSKTSSKKEKTSSQAETSSEEKATTTVIKKVSCVLKCNVVFKYDIEEIKVPDRMVIGKDANGNEVKNPEISIPDFNKLSGNTTATTDKK